MTPLIHERVTTLKTLVFDADGVVIVPPHQFMTHYKEEMGLEPDSLSEFFGGVFQECLVGRADLKEAVVPFLPRWGWSGTVEDFLRRWFEEEHHINKPLIEVVGKLRQEGYRCVVATNQERHRLSYMCEQMGFSRLFDGVFGSVDVGAVKPTYEFYERVTKLLDVETEEIVFWDDTERNVDGARAYGWYAELFTDMDELYRTLELHVGVTREEICLSCG